MKKILRLKNVETGSTFDMPLANGYEVESLRDADGDGVPDSDIPDVPDTPDDPISLEPTSFETVKNDHTVFKRVGTYGTTFAQEDGSFLQFMVRVDGSNHELVASVSSDGLSFRVIQTMSDEVVVCSSCERIGDNYDFIVAQSDQKYYWATTPVDRFGSDFGYLNFRPISNKSGDVCSHMFDMVIVKQTVSDALGMRRKWYLTDTPIRLHDYHQDQKFLFTDVYAIGLDKYESKKHGNVYAGFFAILEVEESLHNGWDHRGSIRTILGLSKNKIDWNFPFGDESILPQPKAEIGGSMIVPQSQVTHTPNGYSYMYASSSNHGHNLLNKAGSKQTQVVAGWPTSTLQAIYEQGCAAIWQ